MVFVFLVKVILRNLYENDKVGMERGKVKSAVRKNGGSRNRQGLWWDHRRFFGCAVHAILKVIPAYGTKRTLWHSAQEIFYS